MCFVLCPLESKSASCLHESRLCSSVVGLNRKYRMGTVKVLTGFCIRSSLHLTMTGHQSNAHGPRTSRVVGLLRCADCFFFWDANLTQQGRIRGNLKYLSAWQAGTSTGRRKLDLWGDGTVDD